MNVALREIGRQLDDFVFPSVGKGGIVIPANPARSVQDLQEGNIDDRSNERRPAAESWQWTAGGQGTASGKGAAGSAASFLGAAGEVVEGLNLDELNEAYPGARVWRQVGGYWLLTESALLSALQRRAVFLTGVSLAARTIRSWGFWRSNALEVRPIGPRHTNFPDGSICGFDPGDGTWKFGDSIVKLLDIYSVRALRHLHLKEYGWWPGPQRAHFVYERITEFTDSEHCGCGTPRGLYKDCCKPDDFARNRLREQIRFTAGVGGPMRKAPVCLAGIVRGEASPPPLEKLIRGS